MTKVDIGPIDRKQHTINQKKGADRSKIGASGFPSAPVLNAITADFAKRQPEVAAFIGKMTYPNDVLSSLLAWKEAKKASADEAAAWVLTNHKDMVLSWVNAEARAKLKKKL